MPANITGWVIAGVGLTLGVAAAHLLLGILRKQV